MDLSGKLVIKATLGDDIRRIPIHNEDITYDELILMMQRVFRDQLSPSDDVALKYKDEDGDLVTLFDSADLATALQISRILKLTVFVNGKIVAGGGSKRDGRVPADVRAELRAIRDKINHILDSLDIGGNDGGENGHEAATGSSIVQEANVQSTNGHQVEASVENGGQAAAVVESKEFDPLQQQHLQVASEKVMQPQQVTGVKLSDDQVSVSSSVSSRPEGHRQPPDVTAAAAAQGYQQQQFQAYQAAEQQHPQAYQQQSAQTQGQPQAQPQAQPTPPPSSTPQPMHHQPTPPYQPHTQPQPTALWQQQQQQMQQQYPPARPPMAGGPPGAGYPQGSQPPQLQGAPGGGPGNPYGMSPRPAGQAPPARAMGAYPPGAWDPQQQQAGAQQPGVGGPSGAAPPGGPPGGPPGEPPGVGPAPQGAPGPNPYQATRPAGPPAAAFARFPFTR